MESASLEPVRWTGTGFGARRSTGGELGLGPSNFAAREAVFEGSIVCCVDGETWRVGDRRVGDVGASGAVLVPRVFSHDGGWLEALLAAAFRSGVLDGVGVDAEGFRGDEPGVAGRTVDGEGGSGEVGRRKGEVRGLLKESGEGL